MHKKHTIIRHFWQLGLLLAIVITLTISTSITHAQVAHAQGGRVLEHMTFDGGGGSSTGGSFRLGGTIGQPDAGELNGGRFTLIGGFWTPLELETTGELEPYSLTLPFVKRQSSGTE